MFNKTLLATFFAMAGTTVSAQNLRVDDNDDAADRDLFFRRRCSYKVALKNIALHQPMPPS
jgi:hypothetical protein